MKERNLKFMSHSVFLSFWVLRKKKLLMSPVPALLSLVSLFLFLCDKNENSKGLMANVYREEEMYSLQVFEFFQLYSSK